MFIYILSDIHGNLPALEIVLKKIKNYSKIIFLGDIVNYGPWSNECVQIIDSIKNKITLLGNHEEYYLNPKLIKNNLVKEFYNNTISSFKLFDSISKYKKNYNFNSYCCTHTIENKKIFEDTQLLIKKDYIIGHSHKQFINKKNDFIIINPGSVGQNRDNLNIISYCKYDLDKKIFEFQNIEYDARVVINKMRELNYPQICIDYYLSKL